LSRDVEFRTREWDQYRRDHNVGRIKGKMDRAFGNDRPGKEPPFTGDDS
jgi:hypothetical protein